jgi:hypothetical protein
VPRSPTCRSTCTCRSKTRASGATGGGAGRRRRPHFVGPTNRLLSPPAAAAGGIVKAAEIRRSSFRLEAAPPHPRPGRCCPSDGDHHHQPSIRCHRRRSGHRHRPEHHPGRSPLPTATLTATPSTPRRNSTTTASPPSSRHPLPPDDQLRPQLEQMEPASVLVRMRAGGRKRGKLKPAAAECWIVAFAIARRSGHETRMRSLGLRVRRDRMRSKGMARRRRLA